MMLLHIYIQNESCHSMNNAYHILKLALLSWMLLSRLLRRRRKEGFRITFLCSHLIFTTALIFLLLESSCILTKDINTRNHHHTYLVFAHWGVLPQDFYSILTLSQLKGHSLVLHFRCLRITLNMTLHFN